MVRSTTVPNSQFCTLATLQAPQVVRFGAARCSIGSRLVRASSKPDILYSRELCNAGRQEEPQLATADYCIQNRGIYRLNGIFLFLPGGWSQAHLGSTSPAGMEVVPLPLLCQPGTTLCWPRRLQCLQLLEDRKRSLLVAAGAFGGMV